MERPSHQGYALPTSMFKLGFNSPSFLIRCGHCRDLHRMYLPMLNALCMELSGKD